MFTKTAMVLLTCRSKEDRASCRVQGMQHAVKSLEHYVVKNVPIMKLLLTESLGHFKQALLSSVESWAF